MNKENLKSGLVVTYIPRHAKHSYVDRELGQISSWNDRFVFVDYGTGTNKATDIEDLEIGDMTFYCANEHDSVMDMAFGRCETQCRECKSATGFFNKT